MKDQHFKRPCHDQPYSVWWWHSLVGQQWWAAAGHLVLQKWEWLCREASAAFTRISICPEPCTWEGTDGGIPGNVPSLRTWQEPASLSQTPACSSKARLWSAKLLCYFKVLITIATIICRAYCLMWILENMCYLYVLMKKLRHRRVKLLAAWCWCVVQ